MYTSLLFKESPFIGSAIAFFILYFSWNGNKKIVGFFIILLLFLILFYRFEPHDTNYTDNVIISPAEGKVTNICHDGKNIHVSIFMSVLNNHTQIYPINGTVIDRYYDETGKFAIVVDREKSRDNEKKIHTIMGNNGAIVTVTQIAGFIPRRITSSEKVPEPVRAGQYLGMIKLGSRIDLSFPGELCDLKVNLNKKINIGDLIYEFKEIK